MTSTPVKNVGFGPGVPTQARAGAAASPEIGFQAVWNNQTEKQADSAKQPQDNQAVKKAPGDSLKARDEHRARTEKREPSRDVEERADIPEEKLEEAAEVLGTAAARVMQEAADAFGVELAEVQEVMADLGLEEQDILTPQGLGSLILGLAGEESPQAFLTDEELYGSYQELLDKLDMVLSECAETLEVSPEQLAQTIGETRLQSGREQPEQELPEQSVTGRAEEPVPPGAVRENEPRETEETAEPDQENFVSRGTAEEKEVNKQHTETDSGEKQSRNGDRHEGAREQGVNPFAQTLKTDQYTPQVQQTYGSESVWDADTQDIMRQIMDYMKLNLKADMSTMEMQLHPASLGTLQVQVASRGGVVTASFITQNEAVKAALESQLVQLQEQFEAQGVKVEAIEVTVQTHQFEQNLEQGRRGGGSGQEPSRKGRVRRINLNDSVPGEEMAAEDAMAKEMMLADGNTVDYMI